MYCEEVWSNDGFIFWNFCFQIKKKLMAELIVCLTIIIMSPLYKKNGMEFWRFLTQVCHLINKIIFFLRRTQIRQMTRILNSSC